MIRDNSRVLTSSWTPLRCDILPGDSDLEGTIKGPLREAGRPAHAGRLAGMCRPEGFRVQGFRVQGLGKYFANYFSIYFRKKLENNWKLFGKCFGKYLENILEDILNCFEKNIQKMGKYLENDLNNGLINESNNGSIKR